MKKIVLSIILLSMFSGVYSQEKPKKLNRLGKKLGLVKTQDTINKSGEEVAKITDYLIISSENDTTYVDTTLTIKKDYKYNYLRKR